MKQLQGFVDVSLGIAVKLAVEAMETTKRQVSSSGYELIWK